MDVVFKNSKLRKELSSEKLLIKRHDPIRARLIRRRLTELRAANTLEDLRSLPQARCHELEGNRAGQISVDLQHPFRLLFECVNEPVPQKTDGGLDWKNVTAIMILGVEDTHG